MQQWSRVVSVGALFHRLKYVDSLIPEGSFRLPAPVQGSDLIFEFYTTRRAPITFLRSRVAVHPFVLIERGDLDAWLRKPLDTLMRDTSEAMQTVRNFTWRIGIYDEPTHRSDPANALLSQKMQRWLYEEPSWKPGLYQNPAGQFDEYRWAMGDFDTSLTKRVHMLTRQILTLPWSARVPVTYANPDSMDAVSLKTFYAAQTTTLTTGDTTAHVGRVGQEYRRNIYYNSMADYLEYTGRIQSGFLGTFMDRTIDSDVDGHGLSAGEPGIAGTAERILRRTGKRERPDRRGRRRRATGADR